MKTAGDVGLEFILSGFSQLQIGRNRVLDLQGSEGQTIEHFFVVGSSVFLFV